MKGKNKLCSIQIRDVNLHFDSYYLIIQSNDGQSFQTPKTKQTIFPRFEMVNSMSPYAKHFSLESEASLIIWLHSLKEEAAYYEFNIKIQQLQFISNDLSEITIYKYPLILFEYSNGFYTTQGFKMNSIHFPNETSMFKAFYNISNTKELNYNTLIEKREKYKASCEELDKVKLLLRLKRSEIELLFQENLSSYNDNVISQCKVASIGESEGIVMEKKSIYHIFQSFIDDIKDMIEDKKDSIVELEKVYKSYKEKNAFNKKHNDQLKQIALITRFSNIQYIKRAMKELSYVFFNKSLNDYITFPSFYNEPFEENKQILRIDYYSRNAKGFALFFGVVIQMMQYLSKQFNIPLRFPLFSQGTKSMIYLSPMYEVFTL